MDSDDFKDRIDIDHTGIAGHFQGGPAVFNAVTNQEHGPLYKAVYAAFAISSYHTAILDEEWGGGWSCDVSYIHVPVFLTAGTGLFDAGTCESKDIIPTEENGLAQGICPLWSLEEKYDRLPDDIFKLIARRKDTDHGDMLHHCDGYMTAWFVYLLQENDEAGEAFTEIQTNTL